LNFFQKLTVASQRNNSLLCVGLDPNEAVLPVGQDDYSRLVSWGENLVSQTADLVCCFKPNIAFYEQFGIEGLRALMTILQSVPPHIPILLDAKRGDIGTSAEAYARAAFHQFHADAITLSPYLGGDSIKAFLRDVDKAAFILCQTSNPSAKEIQQHGKPPLFAFIAQIAQTWGRSDQIGFVVGATQQDALKTIRGICPDHWILAPGVGAQGGNLAEAMKAGLRSDKMGLIVPVSRSIMTAENPRQAAIELKEAINTSRSSFTPTQQPSKQELLIIDLFDSGCVKFGKFTLASGKQSPIYIDLRRVVSFPQLFKKIVEFFLEESLALQFDLVAGVPYAALPISAVTAMELDKPLIYPRKEIKEHGTGRRIEGVFQPGQKVLLLEDVITTGGSLLQAVETMRGAGLKVEDVLVLVDRRQGGPAAMAGHGLKVHAVLDIFEILRVLKAHARVDAATYEGSVAYLQDL
jgi:uridine monophosphate synthetase